VSSYSTTTDLLIGDVPTASTADPAKYVQDAADEIDSRIGHIYATPVDISGTSATTRPAQLLLKRLNNWLATGRLLMSADISGEENQTHAYATRLVDDASKALDMIASGQLVLDGAVKADGFSTQSQGPTYGNVDAESAVEAFYDRVANPNYLYWPTETWPTWYRSSG
jgi:hypothetical protein